jgi:hypothetical protein
VVQEGQLRKEKERISRGGGASKGEGRASRVFGAQMRSRWHSNSWRQKGNLCPAAPRSERGAANQAAPDDGRDASASSA